MQESWREWARFEESKYVLVHFTKARASNADEATYVRIGDTTIKPAEEARYLGVLFDANSHFVSTFNVPQSREHNLHLQFQESQIAHEALHISEQECYSLRSQLQGWTYAAIVWYRPFQGVTPPKPATLCLKAGFCTKGRNEGNIRDLPYHCHHCTSN